jgi:hypothetical protein
LRAPESPIRFETHGNVTGDDQIDAWFVGGDCAGWIYARLLPLPNIVGETEPLMEDWGWYASIKTCDTDTSIALLVYPWDYLDHCWMIKR